MKDKIPYIAVYPTYFDAEMGARDFLKTHYTVVKVNKHNYRFVITLRDGTEYIFMSHEIYRKWRLGQTYRYIGKEEIWHGDSKIKEI